MKQNTPVVIPDVPEPIRAWRVFEIQGDQLGSTAKTYLWSVGKNSAWCFNAPRIVPILRNKVLEDGSKVVEYVEVFPNTHGPVPEAKCQCGFYGLKTIEALDMEFGSILVDGHPDRVIAQILLYGQVMEHEDGYRAEFAEVSQLVPTIGNDQEAVKKVAERYKVPFEPHPEVESFRARKQIAVPSEDGSGLGFSPSTTVTYTTGNRLYTSGTSGSGTLDVSSTLTAAQVQAEMFRQKVAGRRGGKSLGWLAAQQHEAARKRLMDRLNKKQ